MPDDTEVDIQNLLSSEQQKQDAKYKTIEVFKEVEPSFDLGNLLLSDLQPVDVGSLKSNPSAFLKTLARDNAQLLFNKIWELPIERIEDAVVAKLPAPITILPREKPIPKAKALSKWELYAAKKGIQKKKRGRMIWDEEAKVWKPRFGYKRANDDTNQWCMEVPEAADPYEDQFQKAEDAKSERVAKNELQRLRNIARNQKGGKGLIMSTQFKPTDEKRKDKERISREIDVAKRSTASAGKFQDKLPKEKPNQHERKRRKFDPVSGDSSVEKTRVLDIWSKMNKNPKLDVTKAVNKHIAAEQQMAALSKKRKGGSGKVKNKHFRQGKKPGLGAKSKLNMKARTLGKGKKR